MEKGSNVLERYILEYFGVSKDEVGTILPYFNTQQYKKGEIILRSGHYCESLGFLEEGATREYVQLEKQEVTKWISTPGYFVVELNSFLMQQPARFQIQAITDCTLLSMSREDYNQIPAQVPRWPLLEKQFIAKCFAALEDRIMQHLSLNAEARYRQWEQMHSDVIQQVPQHYIASMLGMSAETLSRIRAKR